MKKLLMLILVFSFMSMNIAYAMDIHVDMASEGDIQISQNFDDMTPDNDNDSSDHDVQCQIHCCHAGGHILFFEMAAHGFNLPSGQFSLSDIGIYNSLDHEPPTQPPTA